MKTEITIDGVVYVKKEEQEEKDEDGNIDCHGCQNCRGCVVCDNSTWCDNSTGCYNSTWCDNSTGCDNSVYCLYCCDLVGEKFMVFNKPVGNKEEYLKIFNKLTTHFGYYKHPKQLTESDIEWMQKNIKQFDRKVLGKIIEDSILPDKPRE